MNTRPLFLLVLMTAALHLNRCAETHELDEINVFVQSVLAMANRNALGLPDSPPIQRYTPVVDGQLPVDLQRYLERLVSVSPAAERQTLVAMLWDDSLVVDDDQEPHDVLDQLYRGRRKQTGLEKTPPSVIQRSKTLTGTAAEDDTEDELYQTREDNSYADDF